MTRDSFELLEGFINIGFCAFVEVRVVNVVGVVSPFFFDLRAADFGAMVSSSGDDNRFGSEAFNHGDLIRAGAFGYRFWRSRRQQPRRRCRWSPERIF